MSPENDKPVVSSVLSSSSQQSVLQSGRYPSSRISSPSSSSISTVPSSPAFTPNPSVISSMPRNVNNNNNSVTPAWIHGSKKMCLCSPTTHPGSFRCNLHKKSSDRRSSDVLDNSLSELDARRSAMANSLLRIGNVESDMVRRVLAFTLRPSAHPQRRRRSDFNPRPSRLSVMSTATGE